MTAPQADREAQQPSADVNNRAPRPHLRHPMESAALSREEREPLQECPPQPRDLLAEDSAGRPRKPVGLKCASADDQQTWPCSLPQRIKHLGARESQPALALGESILRDGECPPVGCSACVRCAPILCASRSANDHGPVPATVSGPSAFLECARFRICFRSWCCSASRANAENVPRHRQVRLTWAQELYAPVCVPVWIRAGARSRIRMVGSDRRRHFSPPQSWVLRSACLRVCFIVAECHEKVTSKLVLYSSDSWCQHLHIFYRVEVINPSR